MSTILKDKDRMKEIILNLLLLITGSCICAIGVNGFLRPLNLLSGGVTGIAIVLNHISQINMGIIIFLVNIPLIVIAYFKLNLEFVLNTLFNMTIFSFIIGISGSIYKYIGVSSGDVLASCMIGGALNGFGMGLIFQAGGSQGGLDIIAAIIRRTWDFSIGKILLILNTFIVLWATTHFGSEIFYYTMISMYISYKSVDSVKFLLERKKVLMIITNKHREIGEQLIEDMNRAVTFIEVEGAYKNEKKHMVYTIVNPREIPNIKKLIKKIDKSAFYCISDSQEVKGYRFKERLL